MGVCIQNASYKAGSAGVFACKLSVMGLNISVSKENRVSIQAVSDLVLVEYNGDPLVDAKAEAFQI